MNQPNIPRLNPLIHAPKRLAILSVLITVDDASFNYLKESVEITDGNLSTHLSKLEQAGFVSLEKTFSGKKPLTTVSITETGHQAFMDYLDQLEKLVNLRNR